MTAIDFLLLCWYEEQYVSIQSNDYGEELAAFWIGDLKKNYPQETSSENKKYLESEILGWVIDRSTIIIFI